MPPAAPETILTSPVPSSVIMTGQVEDRGLFKGRIKLLGEGGTPKELVTLGELKSSISLLKMIPVWGDISTAPKLSNIYQSRQSNRLKYRISNYLRLIVEVTATASPLGANTLR